MRGHSVRTLILLPLAMALAVAAGGCGSDDDTPTTPTTPSAPTATETFQGSVGQSGSVGHPFTVATNGTVTMTLTSVAPLSTMSMGVAIARWDGTACGTAVTKNDNARVGATALSGTAAAGNFCVLVYDSGNVPQGWTVDYIVEVKHP